MKKFPLKKLLLALLILLVLYFSGGLLLEKLLDLDTYKADIIKAVQQTLNRPVTYQKGVFTFRFGPSFTFTNVVVKDRAGTGSFITADRLTFTVGLLPLLEKRVVLKELRLHRPVINLSRDNQGVFNIGDLLAGEQAPSPLHIQGVRISKGTFRFVDGLISRPPLTTILEDTDLHLSDVGRGQSCKFSIATTLVEEGRREALSLAGTTRIAPKGEPFIDSRLTARVLAKHLNAGRYWPYYRRWVPFQQLTGQLEINAEIKGKLSDFTSEGTIRATGFRIHYTPIFHAPLTGKDLRMKYAMTLNRRDISVKVIDFTLDGLAVKGSCDIRDINTPDPRITAKATTNRFQLERFAAYIPYGVIVKDPAEFIENYIKGGRYKLEDGRLDGRISQILHMEKGENYNVLFIRATVEDGLLAFHPTVPTFNGIRGTLELHGKDFNLRGISGNFGTSPFTMEGKIADYPLDTPSAYPVSMTMTPRQPEVAWLLREPKSNRVGFVGNSTLRLTGSGFTNGYTLDAEWELTPAAYIYPDFVNKPAGRPNHLSFKGWLSKEEAKVQALHFDLAPLSLSATADYRFKGKERLALSLKSNQFQLQEIAPMVPVLKKYQPAGRAQAAIQGESPTGDPADIRWGGTVTFSGASFKPREDLRPISNLTGNVRFLGTALETSSLTGKLGNSIIYGKGSLSDFRNPSFNLSFSSPTLYLSDLGFRLPQGGEAKAQKVAGTIALKDNTLQIKSLSARLNRTQLNLSGSVPDIRTPRLELKLDSPHLETADLLALADLQWGKPGEPTTPLALKADIRAETGLLGAVPFQKLATTLTLEEKVLYLQPAEFRAFGGKVTGKGRVDFGMDKGSRYQTTFSLERVSAPQFLKLFGMEEELVTGTLTASGELTTRGKQAAELKSSALGSVKFSFEDGSIRKFSVLSKIFSILNVSQLLKFQLPDMVSGGMPYNEITGSIALRDGVAVTNDFFIDSDAMNISAVGKVNLPSEELDLTIGVQPLQTVDKLVNRIPVVGWILTGKEKSFITTYFEAKGKWDNPTVTAIPVKSMAKGVFNIFKRIFELPARLITDTGEVILGN